MVAALDAILTTLCEDPSCCRQRLTHAAGMLYAEHGLDGASTRELARAADVNLAAIAYYFGGKAGLRDAVIDHVVVESRTHLGGLFAKLSEEIATAEGDRPLLSAATYRFVTDMLHVCLSQDPKNWWFDVLMHALGDEQDAETHLVDAVFTPGFAVLCTLAGAATGADRDAPETKVLAASAVGEILVFCRERSIILRQLGWDAFTPQRIDAIAKSAAPAVLSRLGLAPPPAIAAEPVRETEPALS